MSCGERWAQTRDVRSQSPMLSLYTTHVNIKSSGTYNLSHVCKSIQKKYFKFIFSFYMYILQISHKLFFSYKCFYTWVFQCEVWMFWGLFSHCLNVLYRFSVLAFHYVIYAHHYNYSSTLLHISKMVFQIRS